MTSTRPSTHLELVEGSGDRPWHSPLRNETSLERLDRNLVELVAELRVAVTGVQVLFAFLLIVPFNSGFAHIGRFERSVYFVTLILAALAAACTIAPSAHHRFLFRRYDKSHLVRVSNTLLLVGLGFLALAMCGCVLLVATKLFGLATGALTTGLIALPFLALWFALPLRRRARLAAAQQSSVTRPQPGDAPGRPRSRVSPPRASASRRS